jgi:hypothetical protein
MSAVPDHVHGIGDLAPQMWEEVVLATVRDTHTAVADRVFGLLPGTAPIRAVHDGIAGLVYGLLTGATRGTRRVAVAAARATGEVRDPELLARSAAWRMAVAILNGVIGDLLDEQDNPLAIPMAVRIDARDVPLAPQALAAAFPQAKDRIAVLLHGLVEHDESWRFKADERLITYPDVVAAHGVTPVLVRYNTGRHISDNAADLSGLLDVLVRAWPVPVREVLLVGHSMGGLVIRGAGAHAGVHGAAWPQLVRHVVMLGSPHLGAPLEQVANAGAWLLSAVPEARAFGTVLRRRSAGIKDLRRGYLSATDWQDRDPDAWSCPPAGPVGPLGTAVHHSVGATLGPDHRHPLSRVLGDLLVLWGSASAAGHEWAREARVTHVGSADHFALLNHPVVADLLADLCATG